MANKLRVSGYLSVGFLLGSVSAFAGAPASGGNPVLDPTAMDTSINPCVDFYQYSCGNWIKGNPIPSDQSRWDRSFSVLEEQNLATLNSILEGYAKGKFDPPSAYQTQLGEFYASCMDQPAIERATPAALRATVAEIDALKSRGDLAVLVAKLQNRGVAAFFSFGPTADLRDPTLYTAEIDQGGFGLPDSTYYTKTDADSQALRQKYQAHAAKMLELAGSSPAQAESDAAAIVALETALATQALPPDQLQDPTKLYHPIDAAAVAAQAPDFDWNAYYRGLGIAVPQIINLTEAKFLAAVNTAVRDSDLATLRAYLKFHSLESIAPYLGKAVYGEYFNFSAKTLQGQKEMPARWKKCVNNTSGALGMALGQAFVAKTFSPTAKQRADEMIKNLLTAFRADLETLDWLDDATRAQALTKLSMIHAKIGYPDKWEDYSKLRLKRGDFLASARAATLFESARSLKKIGGKVDPQEWGMTPQTVNAYYDPNTNSINFPAAILQPPFFSEQADDASNYGAIGMVIGHEMTHGFDTTGSQFDGTGAMRDWWTPGVKSTFTGKAACLRSQYGHFEALPGVFVNGDLTITENIADQGGIRLSHAALEMQFAKNPGHQPVIAGLSPEQQFFVSIGQAWCENISDQKLKQQVSSDPHSPARFRVVGMVVNNPDFAKAFSCAPGSPMAPADRCSIW